MIPVSAKLAEAIEAAERHPLPRVIVHWDYDAAEPGPPHDISHMVESLTLDRTLAGDLPDQVSLVEGAAAATLDMTLVNPDPDGPPAGRMFTRFNPHSPLFGKETLSAPITFDMGFQTSTGPEYVRRFTGLTRSVKAVSAARAAKLSALDLREKLAAEWDIPQVGRETFGLNASWALAEVINSRAFITGFMAAPFPDGMLGHYLPMNGSLHHPLGIIAGYTARTIASHGYPPTTTGTTWSDRLTQPRFISGPFVAGCYAGPLAVGRFMTNAIRGEFTYDQGTRYEDYLSGRVEFWTKARGNTVGETGSAWKTAFVFTDTTATRGIIAGIDGAGRLAIAAHTGNPDNPTVSSPGPAVPNDDNWHYVGLQWDGRAGGGNYTLTYNLDGTITTATVTGWPYASPLAVTVVKGYWRQPFAELFYQYRPDANNPPWAWDLRNTVNVKLDYSSLELDVIPETTRRSVWEWLRRIAAAEQAVVSLDEWGILHYRTVHRLSQPSAQVPVRVLTSERSVLDLALDDSMDAVRNRIIVTAHPVTVADTPGPVFTTTDVWEVPPLTTHHVTISLTRPALNLDFSVTVNRPDDGPPDPASSFICAAFQPDGSSTGDPITEAQYAGLNITLSYLDERTFDLSVYNFNERTVYLTTAKTSVPTVSIAGRAATIGNQEVSSFLRFSPADSGVDPPIVRRHGNQRLKLPDNPWMQHIPAAASLAQRLVWELYRPQPVIRDLEIIGDPRLQLGDRIRVVDRDGLALTGDYWISGIRETFSRTTGYRQAITARRANTTLRWGQGRWGDHTWGEI